MSPVSLRVRRIEQWNHTCVRWCDIIVMTRIKKDHSESIVEQAWLLVFVTSHFICIVLFCSCCFSCSLFSGDYQCVVFHPVRVELLLLGVFFKTTFTQWSVYGHYDCVFLNIVFFTHFFVTLGLCRFHWHHTNSFFYLFTRLNERYIMTHALLGHESAIWSASCSWSLQVAILGQCKYITLNLWLK